MPQNNYHVLGLMSGTSLDGLDIVEAKFTKATKWNFEILNAKTYSYNLFWQRRLAEAHRIQPKKRLQLSKDFAELSAKYCVDFINEFKCDKIDFISAHGHTVFHQPDKGITLQIGNEALLAQLTQLPVICDFRVQDVQLGGQGAPLVPIGDQLLFQNYGACLNIGGFANISFQNAGRRIAYDICAANKVTNFYAQQLNLDYDVDGKIAESSPVNLNLLEQLNQLSYFNQSPPKSLGLEWIESEVFPLINSFGLPPEHILATFTHHIAHQIALNTKDFDNVLITGGGAHNKYLFKLLEQFLKDKLILPSHNLIAFKEALIFAFLGVLRHRNEINVLADVTGAKQDHSSGVLFYP
ncbi:anhydro-N-acetylmuramic acid kinase [Psychroflexus sp. ALD_RP9]|nr:anhydro-N-acetylmuramic acid kinase [Psychroflexus sp. ALD_RP9]